jgi:hypothetical protein
MTTITIDIDEYNELGKKAKQAENQRATCKKYHKTAKGKAAKSRAQRRWRDNVKKGEKPAANEEVNDEVRPYKRPPYKCGKCGEPKLGHTCSGQRPHNELTTKRKKKRRKVHSCGKCGEPKLGHMCTFSETPRTCRQLREELRRQGLPVSGLKAALVARLATRALKKAKNEKKSDKTIASLKRRIVVLYRAIQNTSDAKAKRKEKKIAMCQAAAAAAAAELEAALAED